MSAAILVRAESALESKTRKALVVIAGSPEAYSPWRKRIPLLVQTLTAITVIGTFFVLGLSHYYMLDPAEKVHQPFLSFMTDDFYVLVVFGVITLIYYTFVVVVVAPLVVRRKRRWRGLIWVYIVLVILFYCTWLGFLGHPMYAQEEGSHNHGRASMASIGVIFILVLTDTIDSPTYTKWVYIATLILSMAYFIFLRAADNLGDTQNMGWLCAFAEDVIVLAIMLYPLSLISELRRLYERPLGALPVK